MDSHWNDGVVQLRRRASSSAGANNVEQGRSSRRCRRPHQHLKRRPTTRRRRRGDERRRGIRVSRRERRRFGEHVCRSPRRRYVDLTNAFFRRLNAFRLLLVPPTFSEDTSSTVTIRQSQTVFLHCLSLGFPKPTIAWYRGNDRRIRNTPTKYQIFPNGTLQIRNAQEGDSGVYVCAANNRGGDARKNVTVDVQCKRRKYSISL